MEQGSVPDWFVRQGIKHLCRQRLKDEAAHDCEEQSKRFSNFLEELYKSFIAVETDKANEQHYEVPAEFYDLCLGEHKKYSSCYYNSGNESLSEAEKNMLQIYLERAELNDGQNILELGCGWGSLTLFMAEAMPNSKITALSNSSSQREYINAQCQQRGISNITVVTQDINEFTTDDRFDRVVSIEMFEHIRNYDQLFKNISKWLVDDGKLFVHIFCHRYLMYPFLEDGDDNWMGRYFFSGGQMPATDTFLFFAKHLKIKQRWLVSGTHYEKTANHWLENMDKNKEQIMPIFAAVYEGDEKVWFERWRIFFMACAELFGYSQGNEWMVGHYLFEKA